MGDTNKHLKKIAAGSSVGLVGIFISALVQFAYSLILVRVLSPSEFGVYTLATVLVLTSAQISTLGFVTGIPKYIANSFGRGDISNIAGSIIITLAATFIVGGLTAIVTYILSGNIAAFFQKPMLKDIYLVLSAAVWAVAVINVQVAIFNGFSNIYPGVFVEQFAQRAFRIIGVFFVAILGGGLFYAAVVFTASSLAVLVILSLLLFRKVRLDLELKDAVYDFRTIFNIVSPLFLILVLSLFNQYSPRLLLGYFSSAEELGYFGVAITLSVFLTMPLNILGTIFLPVITESMSTNKHGSIRELYLSCTKWIVQISLVGFLFIQFQAEFLIYILFGAKYVTAANVLRVVSFGYFFTALCGPNMMTLIALDKSKMILYANSIAALVTVISGILFIPKWGAFGAAVAMALGMSAAGLLRGIILFKIQDIHIVVSKIIKPLISIIIIVVLFNILLSSLPITDGWLALLMGMIIIVACIWSLIFMGGLDEVDIELLHALETRLGGKGNIASTLKRWRL